MKKRILISLFLLISITALVFGETLFGDKLLVQLSISERDMLYPRRIIAFVQNINTKRAGPIWVQYAGGNVYDVWTLIGGSFGYDSRIGTGNLYNGELQAVIANFLRQRQQSDGDPVWVQQADAIAKFFIEYITIDHE